MKSQCTFLWVFLLMFVASIGYSQTNFIPVACQNESFDVSDGDFFFDPGGPGGDCSTTSSGDPGDYPNSNCVTVTTLYAPPGQQISVTFTSFRVFGNFDWLAIFDGDGPVTGTNAGGSGTNPSSGDPVLWNSSVDGDELIDMINAGMTTFTSTNGSLTFAYRFSGVVNTCGWDTEITTSGGGGGGGDSDLPNDLCSNAISVNCGQTINGSTVGSNFNTIPACNLAPYDGGIWYSVVGTGRDITVSTCSPNTNFDTQLAIFTNTCNNLSCVAGNNNDCGRQSTVIFESVEGTTYFIYLTGTAGARGTFSMSVTCEPEPGCTNTSPWITRAAPTNPTPVTISTCTFAGDYNTITGAVAGRTYLFTSSVATDFLTVRQGTPSGPIVGTGTGSVSVTPATGGTLYLHVNTNENCGTQSSCRTTTVACTSCTAVVGCANTTPWLTNPAPDNLDVVTLTTCIFPQEYTTVTNAQSTSTYFITASNMSNFITVRQGTPTGPVIGTGTGSVTVTPTADNVNLYIHLNTNSNCGTATGCNTMTIQCTTCIPAVAGDCADAVEIECGDTVSGSTLEGNINDVPVCGGLDASVAPGVWYAFNADANADVTLVACGNFNVALAVYSGSCSDLECESSSLESLPGKPCDGRNREAIAEFRAFAGNTYYIYVTGGVGVGAAGDFTLDVSSCETFTTNDNCVDAIALACGTPVTGSTVGASSATVPFCGTSLSSAPGVWYTFVGNGGDATVSLCGSSYDTKIGVFSGTCAALVCEAGNDDSCGLQSSVTFTTEASTTYYVYVTGFSSNAGLYTLELTCNAPPIEVYPGCASATAITCGGTVTGSTVGAPTNPAVGTCITSLTTAGGRWHTIVGNGQTIQLTTCNPGTNYDTKLGVFTGSCAALTCVTGNDDGSPGGGQDPACFSVAGINFNRASTVTFASVSGTTYYIYVTGFLANTGSYELSATCSTTLVPDVTNRAEEKKLGMDDFSETNLQVGNFFPNPVTTNTVMLQIDSPSNTEGTMNIVDQTGRIVESNQLFLGAGTNVKELNVTKYPAGTYVASIIIDNEITQRRFVVIK